jgi:hypothetical protein
MPNSNNQLIETARFGIALCHCVEWLSLCSGGISRTEPESSRQLERQVPKYFEGHSTCTSDPMVNSQTVIERGGRDLTALEFPLDSVHFLSTMTRGNSRENLLADESLPFCPSSQCGVVVLRHLN